ncbi:MAG: formyltransferase family protein [Planctomycetota bacterium]
MTAPSSPLSIGFMLSGTGRTLDNLVAFLANRPELGAIRAVLSDRPGVLGLEKAERFGIPHHVMPCARPEDSAAIFAWLDDQKIDYVLLGGWLKLLKIAPGWEHRVLNIHPSLIPKFSGHGFYGSRVHRAVIAAGERESGCTVHFVDDIYDHGPVLLQRKVPVLPDDTTDTLADRVFEAECDAYPEAIELLASGAVRFDGDELIVDRPA